jgi:hypothetical protein
MQKGLAWRLLSLAQLLWLGDMRAMQYARSGLQDAGSADSVEESGLYR